VPAIGRKGRGDGYRPFPATCCKLFHICLPPQVLLRLFSLYFPQFSAWWDDIDIGIWRRESSIPRLNLPSLIVRFRRGLKNVVSEIDSVYRRNVTSIDTSIQMFTCSRMYCFTCNCASPARLGLFPTEISLSFIALRDKTARHCESLRFIVFCFDLSFWFYSPVASQPLSQSLHLFIATR